MNKENCPVCHNHCPKDELKCGRGKMYFEGKLNPEMSSENQEHKFNHTPQNELTQLIRQCGHFLHHGGDEQDLFNTLSDEEKSTLLALLKKVTNKINNR
ncbi:MAG: hypothetical protein ACI4PF_00245 [Christensenellales bacterium]